MSYVTETLSNLIHQTAFFNLTWGNYLMIAVACVFPVSYTHLDVYKRQHLSSASLAVGGPTTKPINGVTQRNC